MLMANHCARPATGRSRQSWYCRWRYDTASALRFHHVRGDDTASALQSHCVRGYDTASAMRLHCMLKCLPVAVCVSARGSVFSLHCTLKTLPLPCVFTASVAEDTAFSALARHQEAAGPVVVVPELADGEGVSFLLSLDGEVEDDNAADFREVTIAEVRGKHCCVTIPSCQS